MAKTDDTRKVRQDIVDRDRKDIDKGYRGSRVFKTSVGDVPLYPNEFGRLSKTDKMAYRDALEREYRRGDNETLAREIGLSPKLRGKKITKEEGQTTRDRLKKRYGVENKAKGGSVSKRGDGIAQRGKTKGKMR